MPEVWDVVVIGAGIFGSVIARALHSSGCQVLVVDDAKPHAGSTPAACLMKPSWFSAMGKALYEPSLSLLDRQYGLQSVSFRVLRGHVSVHWVPPRAILERPPYCRTGTVRRLIPDGKRWRVELTVGGEPLFAAKVVIAAGIWTRLLAPVDVQGYAGLACLWPKRKIADPFIKVWAPYRQLVAFNRGDGLWVGDGTSTKNWAEKYRAATLTRARNAVEGVDTPQELFGYRPYVAGSSPCFLEETRPGCWVATGGAKNGTIAAAWCAHVLTQRFQ